jgi:hypothetical protein
MKKPEKYGELRQFILENFETTTNRNDRLHTQDIINIAYNNKFSFSDCKIAEVFKSLHIGEHRSRCTINIKVQTGYYFLIYKGGGEGGVA